MIWSVGETPQPAATGAHSTAGMGEDGRAVAFDMLIEPDAGAGLGHDRCERGFADLKRITPQVVAVQFDQAKA